MRKRNTEVAGKIGTEMGPVVGVQFGRRSVGGVVLGEGTETTVSIRASRAKANQEALKIQMEEKRLRMEEERARIRAEDIRLEQKIKSDLARAASTPPAKIPSVGQEKTVPCFLDETTERGERIISQDADVAGENVPFLDSGGTPSTYQPYVSCVTLSRRVSLPQSPPESSPESPLRGLVNDQTHTQESDAWLGEPQEASHVRSGEPRSSAGAFAELPPSVEAADVEMDCETAFVML